MDHWEEKPFMSQSHDLHIGMSNSISTLYTCSLLKNHGPSLKLMAEAESIINSRPLTVETMNDISSEAMFHTSMVMNTSMLVPSS